MKKKSRVKNKLTRDDAPVVTRQTRLSGGAIDAIWVIIFDDKGNEYLASVHTAPESTPEALAGIVEPSEGDSIPVFTAEPQTLDNLDGIAQVLNDVGYRAGVSKFYVMPQQNVDLKFIYSHLVRMYDAGAAGLNEQQMRLYSRAVTALKELKDLEGGDKRRLIDGG